MRVILRSLLLSLIIFTALPAWYSCCGQDTAVTTSLWDESQQPQQTPPPANPSSQPTTSSPPNTTSTSPTLVDNIDAGEMDDDTEEPRRGMVKWKEYRGPYITARAGLGFLVDTASYAQDAASKEQIAMLPSQRLRDFRFVTGGS